MLNDWRINEMKKKMSKERKNMNRKKYEKQKKTTSERERKKTATNGENVLQIGHLVQPSVVCLIDLKFIYVRPLQFFLT